ncbi:M20/M25/M40 family metallo-hydrolase [Sphingomonas jatrophae]|uniref:Acetylornithine deacetylase/Succinyl-diaminopimelate desuccinylase n=1 Tax=Sphingomonas jatrophae TaxID=1166337 RepID=A0A1I6M8G5_9SPHN|nr:M20/M25/M40 family metallo-hydrolase [Sphingomonas jatrophae]SFS11913.1 Acetylornithine deacetylase/Succinyl-diaminopimelate desuccinylase [Sphingomonas jatrophae]
MRRFKAIMMAAACCAMAGSASAASPSAEVRTWRQAHEREILADFSKLLAMPNVATNLPDVERNAAYISGLLETRGFKTRLLRASPGTPPSVFAELRTPGAKRTVVFYAHYDGQPVAQKGWLNPPFQPTLRTAPPEDKEVTVPAQGPINPDWRIYARSAGDDKAPIQAMISALDALKARGIKPSVNIKLLYEGEEEQGSPNFGRIIAQNLELVRGDLLIFGDGPMHQSGKQLISGGNRGIAGFTAMVYGPNKPLHDGHYGSWVPSPSVMIADLVMSLRTEDGRILIPGIADEVTPATAADKAGLAAMPPVEEDLKKALGLGRTIGPKRLADGYLSPTLNVRAIHAGDDGPNAANAIATEASASFDFRLAPGQTPARIRKVTEAYLTSKGWFIVRDTPDAATRLAHPKIVRLAWDEGSSIATKTPLETPAAQAVAKSIGRTVGYDVIQLPIVGGSSGFAEIVNQLKAPMVTVSIANYDDNQHARNENLRIGNLWDGIEVYAGLVADLDW